MARPKLGETETERMQLKITAAEIQAIDDWRFANRIASRSEAVRRLCQIALTLDGPVSELGNEAGDGIDFFIWPNPLPSDHAGIARQEKAKTRLQHVCLRSLQISGVAGFLKSGFPIDEALKRGQEIRDKFKKNYFPGGMK